MGPVGDPAAMNGDLDITQTLTLQGAGTSSTIISGGGLDRVFETIGLGIVVTMNDLTITGGKGEFDSEGGAIFNVATLNLTRVHMTDNESPSNGGAIANQAPDGVLNVTDSAFTNNRADPSTGADGGVLDSSGRCFLLLHQRDVLRERCRRPRRRDQQQPRQPHDAQQRHDHRQHGRGG